MIEKLKKVSTLLKKDELGFLPASLTYYFVLAIIPILTLIVLMASSFNVSIDRVTTLINEMLPHKIANFLVEIVSGKGFDTNVGIFNIIAFIGASRGTYAIVKTANNLYNVKDSDIIKDRIKSVIILLNILILLIFLLVVPIFGENILLLLQNSKIFSGITDELILVVNAVKWPFTALILFFDIKLIYTISPSKKVKSSHTTAGAMFTSMLWISSSLIFGYYLEYFANYDILYGNLSSIIILMIWLYVLSYVFVLGMIINTTYYKEK